MNEIASSDFREPQPPHIETLRTPWGEVSYSPERGGIITSIKLSQGDQLVELLYLDAETFNDPTKNVKGGIPILFPNAGPIDSPLFPGLKQHGFGRDAQGWESEQGVEANAFTQVLEADDRSRQVFPYDHMLRVGGKFSEDGSLTLTQSVTNRERERDLPLSMGLHPYFPVPAEKKGDIQFQFPGGDIVEESVEQWANGKAVKIDNPKVKDPSAVLRVHIPALGTLVMDVSPAYKKLWVWSQPGKDFVCVEPVMRNAGGLVDDPELVKPGETYSGTVTFRLE